MRKRLHPLRVFVLSSHSELPTGHEQHSGRPQRAFPKWVRWPALALVALRFVMPLIAVPLIPVLVRDQIALLVLLRPQKEFLLLAGAQARLTGTPSIGLLVLAFIPSMVIAVWAFFITGRAYGHLLGDDGPRWLNRAIPPARLAQAHLVLERRGPWIAVLGRLAAFPPTFLAAAAGSSDVPARHYLAADLFGAILSFGVAVGAGWMLGRTYSEGGPWLTGIGVGVFVILIVLLTRWIKQVEDEVDVDGVTNNT